ncbi:sulfatase/phosphatase domain-containing protein, partial [Anaerostipes sp.]|uniref:sulfatase/phosphatase domain-containing protein n=1 Tax=Anaerostipes sp. TaxID=1872530 RepID=UPI003FEFAFFF
SFFLTVSYDEPHGPSLCPKPYNHMYDGFKFDSCPNFQDDLSKKPFMQRLWSGKNLHATEDEINRPTDGLSLFLGCNSYVDYEIGRVLDKIREVAPDALVIFTSDHGDMLGAHRLFSKNAAAYKEVANIPLIIKGGAKGYVEEAMASHIDIAPTILDYFDIPIPKLMEGKSMLSQIENPEKEINDVIFTEFTRYEIDHDGFGGLQIMRAAISKRYKLVIHLLDSDEFYDMEKDPYEINNLIDDENYVEERNALHDKLIQHMNDTRDLYRGYQWRMRPWRKDFVPNWENEGYTRQRENEEYEPRQLDYDTGLPMKEAVRKKC